MAAPGVSRHADYNDGYTMMRNRMLGTILTVLACFALPAAAQEAPDALVKRLAEEVLTQIRADKDLQSGNQEKVKQIIETKLVPHFDFPRMTALAMGRNWKNATPEQQQQLTDQFRTLLVRTYSGALANYRDNVMDYKPLRMNAGDTEVTVRTEVRRSGQAPVQIDYSMEKMPDGWKAYDVIVAGVSLVTNYRDEFNDTVKSSGVDGLIAALKKKNAGPPPAPK